VFAAFGDASDMDKEVVRAAVAEGLARAIKAATGDAKVGTIIVRKLVVNVTLASGGGATVNVRNYAYKQELR
jgi:hypothetical protein